MGAVARMDVCHTDCLVAFEDDSGNSRIRPQVEIGLDIHDAVDISYKDDERNVMPKILFLPVAASLRLPVSRLMYLAQISDA